jgi:hypothetical protein
MNIPIISASVDLIPATYLRREWAVRRCPVDPSSVIMDAPKFGDHVVVQAEDAEGRIWQHRGNWTEVLMAGSLDPEHWIHIRTTYGSPAWFERDVEGQIREIEQRYDEGDPHAFADLFKAL